MNLCDNCDLFCSKGAYGVACIRTDPMAPDEPPTAVGRSPHTVIPPENDEHPVSGPGAALCGLPIAAVAAGFNSYLFGDCDGPLCPCGRLEALCPSPHCDEVTMP